jgi:hypothetical protein
LHKPVLEDVCRRAGVASARLSERPINGGVPHIIPKGLQDTLSDEWLRCLDLFPSIDPWPLEAAGARSRECHIGPQRDWIATMWAVVLAAHRLNLEPILTQLCILNFNDHERLPPPDPAGPGMIHYCYPSAGFNKHLFDGQQAAEGLVWNVPADDGTVGGCIRRQLREAREFYGLVAAENA